MINPSTLGGVFRGIGGAVQLARAISSQTPSKKREALTKRGAGLHATLAEIGDRGVAIVGFLEKAHPARPLPEDVARTIHESPHLRGHRVIYLSYDETRRIRGLVDLQKDALRRVAAALDARELKHLQIYFEGLSEFKAAVHRKHGAIALMADSFIGVSGYRMGPGLDAGELERHLEQSGFTVRSPFKPTSAGTFLIYSPEELGEARKRVATMRAANQALGAVIRDAFSLEDVLGE
jgi:hypothetical protein